MKVIDQYQIMRNMPKGLKASRERLSGWGRYSDVDCVVVYPKDVNELQDTLRACSKYGYSVTPKGSGCSFGDIITNREGIVVDMTSWNKILAFDHETGTMTAQGGTSAARVLHTILPYNWIMAGLPGTSAGTMAGFISNNVHGKDSFENGNFGTGVVSMKILLAGGKIINVSRSENPDLFYAVIGGMGLLGIILEATFKLVRIPGSMVEVERKYFPSITKLFDMFNNISEVDMDAAWFDAFSKKRKGIFQTARWLNENPEVQPASMESISKKFMGKIPINIVYPIVKPFACRTNMRILNNLAYWGSMMGRGTKTLHLYQYYYPHVTSIPDCPTAIKGGLVGFHIMVPDEKALDFIVKLLDLCGRYKLESWFGGVKRLRADTFLMSFSDDGFATTIEIPGRFTMWRRFPEFLDKMISFIVDYNGKVFLGKDTLLKPHHIRAMYRNLPKFLKIRENCDPQRLFGSDHSRRLSL